MNLDPAPDAACGDDDDLASALAQGQFGAAWLDEDLNVLRRLGPLSRWLPPPGAPACASPALLGMEDSLAALRVGGAEMILPSLRLPDMGTGRISISIRWDAPRRRYVIVAAPDHGGEQIDRLLAAGRREKQLLQQQAEAAMAQARVADALYRDIVETSGYLILRFNADFKIAFVNDVVVRFFDAPQEALLGRPVHELFPAIGQDTPWRLDMCAEGPAIFEAPARGQDGALHWLWWEVRWSGGQFQAAGRDATLARRLRAERDKAQEEARAAAVANERLRIAHALHDTLARSLVNLIARSRLLAKTAPDEAARAELKELEEEARAGLRETRDAIAQMRAARRAEDDPRAIVDVFGAGWRANGGQLRADIDPPSVTSSRGVEELIARVLREALRNVALHSGARRASVTLRREAKNIRLDILDDGVGFDPSAPTPGHYGVVGMRELARLCGAHLEIASAPGQGTRVTLNAPGR